MGPDVARVCRDPYKGPSPCQLLYELFCFGFESGRLACFVLQNFLEAQGTLAPLSNCAGKVEHTIQSLKL